MTHVRPVILTVVLLFSLGAVAQQSAARPGAQSNQPQTAQPNQEPQPAPPSQQSPATPPTQSQSPQAQPSGPAPGNQPPSIDEQVKVLAQELNLNDDQQGKLKTVLVDQRQQAATVISDNSLPREDKVQKIRALREATIAKVRGLLNDDQKKKLDQILEGPSERPEPKEPPK